MILSATVAGHIADYIRALASVYTLVIIAYILTNLVFAAGLRIPYSRGTDAILSFLREVTEPYLRLFRRILPSFGGLDFSPIIAIIVLQLAARLLAAAIGP